MKKYTQSEFDAIPRNENGIKICPTGDYSAIKNISEACSFGERCSFGKGCSFGEWCSFGERCSFGKECKAISPYWGFMSAPKFEIEGRIYPPACARDHWAERLARFNIVAGDACYDAVWERIKPKMREVLAWDGWSACERMILESWADDKKGESKA